jgi:V/A-type H+/Na+-transporting ATPase subunit G/H
MAEEKDNGGVEYEDISILPQIKKKEQEVSKLLEIEKENAKKIIEEAKKKAGVLIDDTKKELPVSREKRREESIKQAGIEAEKILSDGEQMLKNIKEKAYPNLQKVAKIILTEVIPN